MRLLTNDRLDPVAGGFNTQQVALGVAVIGLGISIAVTGGLAAVPIGILGAASLGELGLVATSLTLGGAGGAIVGRGMQN